MPLIDYGAVTTGYRYRSSPVLGASEDISPLLAKELAGEPGTRAPHVAVITFGGREISTIDLYGQRFVLLACHFPCSASLLYVCSPIRMTFVVITTSTAQPVKV
jgi:hypothetical protein